MRTLGLWVLALVAVASGYAASGQVMAAKSRQKILATAKAIFEPEVRNSVKVGRIKSPFGVPQLPTK